MNKEKIEKVVVMCCGSSCLFFGIVYTITVWIDTPILVGFIFEVELLKFKEPGLISFIFMLISLGMAYKVGRKRYDSITKQKIESDP